MKSSDLRPGLDKPIDLLNISEEDQFLLGLLFDEVNNYPELTPHVYYQNIVYCVNQHKIILKQPVIFYETIGKPGCYKAVVVDLQDKNIIGAGAFAVVYPVIGTVFRDESGKCVYKKKVATPKSRVLYRYELGLAQEPSNSDLTVLKMPIYDFIKQSALMRDRKSKSRLAHFHGKKPIYDAEYGYIIAKRFVGKTLYEYLNDDMTFQSDAVRIKICVNLFLALAKQIHANGIIHRDLKPENILINPNDLSINIIDLGLATKAPDHAFCGTPIYIPAETIQRIKTDSKDKSLWLDKKSDVYVMGLIAGLVLGMPFDRLVIPGINTDSTSALCALPNAYTYPVNFHGFNNQIIDLMKKLFHHKKSVRPKAGTVAKLFELILASRQKLKEDKEHEEQVGLKFHAYSAVSPYDNHYLVSPFILMRNHANLRSFESYQQWLADLKAYKNQPDLDQNAVGSRVLTGVINYLEQYATEKNIKKRVLAGSEKRVNEINELIQIAFNADMAENEKRTAIKALFKQLHRKRFFGMNKLQELVTNALLEIIFPLPARTVTP